MNEIHMLNDTCCIAPLSDVTHKEQVQWNENHMAARKEA